MIPLRRLTGTSRVVDAHDLAITHLEDGRKAQAELQPASASVADDMPDKDDVITGVDKLINVELGIAELLNELLGPQPLSNLSASSVYGSIWELSDLMPLDLGVQVFNRRVEIVAIEGSDPAPHNLYVLLRHRPCSIPRAVIPCYPPELSRLHLSRLPSDDAVLTQRPDMSAAWRCSWIVVGWSAALTSRCCGAVSGLDPLLD